MFVVTVDAEILYLKDGQIMKGTIASQDERILKLRTEQGELSIQKSQVTKIDFSNEIKKEDKKDDRISDDERRAIIAYSGEMKRKKRADEQRGKSIFALGTGIGLPYGLIGYSAEILVAGHIGLTAGLDISPGKFQEVGAKIYFGKKENKFRPRIGVMVGDTYGVLYNDAVVAKVSGVYPFVGFQWKFISWMSLDIDLGYIMHSQRDITYTYGSGRGRTTAHTRIENSFFPAIGLMFHF